MICFSRETTVLSDGPCTDTAAYINVAYHSQMVFPPRRRERDLCGAKERRRPSDYLVHFFLNITQKYRERKRVGRHVTRNKQSLLGIDCARDGMVVSSIGIMRPFFSLETFAEGSDSILLLLGNKMATTYLFLAFGRIKRRRRRRLVKFRLQVNRMGDG